MGERSERQNSMGWKKLSVLRHAEAEGTVWIGAGVRDERAGLTNDAPSQPGGWGLEGKAPGLVR